MKKEDIKTIFVWRWHDHLHRKSEELKESTKTLLELMCDFSKVAEYKVNIQKSIAFLYTNNEQVKFEIKNNTIFISIPQKWNT